MSDIFKDYSFGGWLRHFRIERGLTLRQASAMLKTNPGNYSKMECSRLAPPSNHVKVKKIAKTLKLGFIGTEILLTAAFSYHVGKLRKRREK